MSENDIIGIASLIYLSVLFVGLSLFIACIHPISRWVEKMMKKRSGKAA